MKKLLSLLLFVGVACFSGCSCKDDKIEFNYFENKTNNVQDHKYYLISQEIYNGDLLLYKHDKNVYIDDNKYKIIVDVKEINDLDEEELYSNSKEEYYRNENDFYYKEDGVWKIKENESVESIGFSIKKDMFEKYSIKEENGNKILSGDLKKEKISEFLGFELNDVDCLKLTLNISSEDKVKNVSLEYVDGNYNKVIISLEISYSQMANFELPDVG